MTWVVAGGAVMIAATVGLVAFELASARQSALMRTERTAQSTARMLAEQAFRSVDAVALTMHAVADAILQASDRRLAPTYVREILRSRTRTATELRDLVYVPADGIGAVDVTGNAVPPIALERLPYVQQAIRKPGQVVLGRPAAGRHLGETTAEAAESRQFHVPMARAVTTVDGQLLGVVIGLINPDFFVSFFSAVEAGEQGVIRLIHYEGPLAASTAAADGVPGAAMQTLPFFRAGVPRSERGLYRATDPDGTERITAFRVLRTYPLVLTVGLSVAEALDDWRKEAAIFAALAGAIVALIGAGLFFAWRQIAAAQRRERDLAESEALKSGILASALDGIVDTDEDGRIAAFNPAAERIFGRERESVLGRPMADVLLPGDEAEALQALIRAAGSSGGRRIELQAVRADGETFPAEVAVTATATERGRVYTAYLRDITDRRRAEADLRAARERADAANVAKSEFLATISHEIRTPMNGIMGMASILQETNLSAEQRRYLSTIQSSSASMLRLINDLLDFSRLETGQFQLEDGTINVDAVATAAIDLVAPMAQAKGLMLAWRRAVEVPETVPGDAGRLRQVLLNLLDNAVKFTARGSVTLSIEAVDDGAGVQFRVVDTGIGIPTDALERIFERFEQVDASITRRFGGTGLGLAIARSIVERMGGAIGVASRPGAGSRFWFRIPAGTGPPASSPGPLPAAARVLVVEPDPAVRDLLVAQLRDWGIEGMAAASAGEAAAAITEMEQDGRGLPDTAIIHAGTTLSGPAFARTIAIAERPQPGALCPVHPAALRQALSDAPQDAGRLKILVAEDNPINQQVLATMLQGLGHGVTLANDGREALQQATSADFDLVLMDIQMPEMSGLEATRQIRALPPPRGAVPVVAATAMDAPEDRRRFLAAGMADVLVKPITRSSVERVLAGRKRPQATAPPPPETGASPAILDEGVLRDLEKALGRESFIRLVRQMLDQGPPLLTRLEAVRQGGEAAALREAAHALVGSLRSFGLIGAADAARAIEQLARSGRTDAAAAAVPLAVEAALQGLDALRRWIDARPPSL
ncbi:hypothetical protein STAQ_01680 [Allostella sp. ATCC 35155]|nr:hypothetical protein STAQ_01680 [Stella sp. ATCC 35155]